MNQAHVFLQADENEMRIEVINDETMRMWRQDFKAGFLEQISSQTGQPLSYLKFVQMLVLALSGKDKNVFVDLVDINELQLLKGKQP